MNRYVLLLVTFLVGSQLVRAQPVTAKIYFVSGNGYDLTTGFDPAKPIRLKNCCPILLEIDADTLELLVDNKRVSVPVQRGKSYYFGFSNTLGLRELSELEYWLGAAFYKSQSKQRRFLLSRKSGVIEGAD